MYLFRISVLFIFISTILFGSGCNSDTLLKAYNQNLKKTNSIKTSNKEIISMLENSFKPSSILKGLIEGVTNGTRVKEVQKVLAVRKMYRIDPKTLKSYKLVKYYKSLELSNEPSLTKFSNTFNTLGNLISATQFLINLDSAIRTGDRQSILDLHKQSFELSTGMIITKASMRAAKMGLVVSGFLDYALTSLMTQELKGYEEYWWIAYSKYLNKRYPHLVKGSNSWVNLAMKNDNGRAFRARLMEFWESRDVAGDGIESAIERAAHYYKPVHGLRRGDALAMAKFKDTFASRYYNDYLKITIDTYMKRKITKEKEALKIRLKNATTSLCGYWNDINNLAREVQKIKSKSSKTKTKKVLSASDQEILKKCNYIQSKKRSSEKNLMPSLESINRWTKSFKKDVKRVMKILKDKKEYDARNKIVKIWNKWVDIGHHSRSSFGEFNRSDCTKWIPEFMKLPYLAKYGIDFPKGMGYCNEYYRISKYTLRYYNSWMNISSKCESLKIK